MADTTGPAPYDLKIYRGDGFEFFFRLYQEVFDEDLQLYVKGDPLDLTTYDFLAQIRTGESSIAGLIVELTTDIPDQGDPENLGYVSLKLSKTQTAALGDPTLTGKQYVKIGVWDCEMIQPDGDPQTIWAGDAMLRPDVARSA